MTKPTIVASFAAVHLVPFDAEKLRTTAAANTGQKHVEVPMTPLTELRDVVVPAAANACRDILRVNKPGPTTPKRRARVAVNQIYSSFEMVRLQKEKAEEDVRTKRQKAAEQQKKDDDKKAARKQREEERLERQQKIKATEQSKKARMKAQEEQRKKKRAEEAVEKASRRCRECDSIWRNNCLPWSGCEKCTIFWCCNKCFTRGKRPGEKLVKTHQARCPGE